MPLENVRGFVFDIDGTLVQRDGETLFPIPGAREVLDRIAASGRPYAFFTNGSHLAPTTFAHELRSVGLPIDDERMLTPLCSVQAYLSRLSGTPSVLVFATDEARTYLRSVGVNLVEGDAALTADAVFVAHTNSADFDRIELAARAVLAGAKLLTGSYVPVYAGANGPIFSRGAMITAAIAKASSTRPIVVGKPSRAAVQETSRRLGLPAAELVIVGDDVRLEVALGHLGGSKTILVRSGISGSADLNSAPASQRPHLTVDTVAELLPWL